jgi:hypothetical protein
MRTIEIILAFAGAFICAAVSILFAASQASAGAGLWPLPGLVFVELVFLGQLGLLAAAREAGIANQVWGYVPWGVTGVLTSLVILGGFSIGPFLLPAALCFLMVSLISLPRWRVRTLPSVGLAVLTALAQSVGLLLPLFLGGQA